MNITAKQDTSNVSESSIGINLSGVFSAFTVRVHSSHIEGVRGFLGRVYPLFCTVWWHTLYNEKESVL